MKIEIYNDRNAQKYVIKNHLYLCRIVCEILYIEKEYQYCS